MTTISAQTILRSRNAVRPDKVLSTLLLRYPRFIHAELMTHRQFSRNAASSRAIPISKLIEDVRSDPAIPLHWGKNQKGMRASRECINSLSLMDVGETMQSHPYLIWVRNDHSREEAWLLARDKAIEFAEAFAEAGYHKQIANRLLEPFAHITVLVSATEWSNFLALRDHRDAEPHIAMLAREVRKELDREDNIQELEPGEWHLPFTDDYENEFGARLHLSVARCASTSYKTVDGFDMSLERAIRVHDQLVGSSPLHASPAEHTAQADDWIIMDHKKGFEWENAHQHGNFEGFRQYRKMLPNECL